MELKNIKTQVTYRIEPSGDGGFIAKSSDPGVPSIQGQSREELQQKIREQAFHKLEGEFPVLKEILEKQLQAPAGGKTSTTMIVGSKGFEKQIIADASPEQVAELAKEVGDFVEKKFPTISRVVNVRQLVNHVEQKAVQNLKPEGTEITVNSSAIVPESGSRLPWILLALLLLACLTYFFLYHR
jgi:hypothetical protein